LKKAADALVTFIMDEATYPQPYGGKFRVLACDLRFALSQKVEDMTTDDAIFIEFMRKLWERSALIRHDAMSIEEAIRGINAADQDWKDRMLKQFAEITAPPIKGGAAIKAGGS
jgi:hypothetical protein